MPTLFTNHPEFDPVEVTWGHWLRVQYRNRTHALRWALRHPASAPQKLTRLPWGRRALPLAVRTHLGRVDVGAMRDAMARMPDAELVRYCAFGPAPRGRDEVFEEANAFDLALDEWAIRRGIWGGHDDWALALRWMAEGEPRIAAWVRVRIDLAEDRPPGAIPIDDREEPV